MKTFMSMFALTLVLAFTVPAFAGIPAIPEPSTMVLVGLGAVGIIAVRQFRARSKKQ